MTNRSGDQGEPAAKTPSVLDSFLIFKDEPLFSDVEVRDGDAFNHEAFAETILKLLVRNKPPLSIGLFGSWGIGKSSIVNILRRRISETQSDTLKDIYFNAWKYSGDSFRRQFLIEVARQVYGDDHEEVRRIQQLNYSEVLKQSYHQQSLPTAIAQAVRDAFSVKFAFRGSAVARLIIGCVSVLFCVALSALVSRWSPPFASLLLIISIPAIFVWFSGMKFDEVFVLHEEPVYDPKLIFPEQFEAEFRSIAQSKTLNGRKLVIAIDDIDRCEPSLIKDILVSAKNFIGHENCFFLIPCDDKTVIDIFAEPSQKEGYRDESLRKYFNVALRIPPITSTDLVDFANTISRQTNIPDDIVQLAVMANCRDPRKMKHFLNSLEMKYQVAKARERAGVMPKIVDDNLLELAKVVLIENAYPSLFSKLVENPRILELLEKAVLEPGSAQDLSKYELQEWQAMYPGLGEVLERTRQIRMKHADVFFPLKSTNIEVRIPHGTDLKAAIVEGNSKLVDELVSAVADDDERIATADLLVDLLQRSSGPFLRNAISAALRMYCVDSFFPTSERMRVGRASISALIYKDTGAILSQTPEHLLRCAKEMGSVNLDRILDEYFMGIGKLPSAPVPDNLSAVVLAIYKFSPDRARFAALLNNRFEAWADHPEGLSVLETLTELNRLPEQERIPSDPVVSKMLDGLEHVNAGFNESDIIRRKLIFANWKKGVGERFVEWLVLKLQEMAEMAPDNDHRASILFILSSVALKPEIVETNASSELWQLLPPLVDNLFTESKTEVTKAGILFASRSKDRSVCSDATRFVLEAWSTVSDSQLRKDLEFTKHIDTTGSQGLLKQGVEQELDSIRNEGAKPTDRTWQRVTFCLDYKNILEPDSLEQALLETVESKSAESLKMWLGVLMQQCARLDRDFASRLAIRCLEVAIENPGSGDRQECLLQAFVDVLPMLSPTERPSALQKYFSLMKNEEPETRIAAASKLEDVRERSSETQDFKLAVANVIKYLRDEVKTVELPEYRAVLDAFLTQNVLLGEYQNRDLANMAKDLMSQTDDSLQGFGLHLVEQMRSIPKDDEAEVIHVLIGIARSSPNLADRISSRLRQFSPESLEENTRQELTDWFESGH